MEKIWPKAMVTGHRLSYLSPEELRWSEAMLAKVFEKLQRHHGLEVAISGLALGADTIWADLALAKDIPLAAYIPFESQASTWPPQAQAHWRHLRAAAASEKVLGESYGVQHFHARNDAMLKDSDVVVALLKSDVTKGGTFSAVSKARRLQKPLLLLDPLLRTVVSERVDPEA